MHRRTFSQLLAMGAAALGMVQAEQAPPPRDANAVGGANAVNDPPAPPAPAPAARAGAVPEPVNVADFTELARQRLAKATFDYISTGSADEFTLRENLEAFQRLKILPPLLHGVPDADLTTTVLGQEISLPILLAPVAGQRMYHPQGGLAAARAAAAEKTIYGMSSSVGHSVEELAAASNGPKWFQLYVPKDRAVTRRLVERVERAGFQAIVLTVDLGEWKDADRRNRFALPHDVLFKHLRDIGFEQVTDSMSYEQLLAFNAQAWDLSLSWDFFGWLREVSKLPLLIKGVLRPEDARRAVSLGLGGIVVSNHGGRRLDGMPASIDMLPSVVEAVGGKVEIYVDGGIRRGTDVLKALALGARAVLIGRPYAWALAADGEAGVRKVIQLLRDELKNAMVASGCPNVRQIDRSLVLRD